MKNRYKERNIIKIIKKMLLLITILILGLLIFLSVTEYRPEDIERATMYSKTSEDNISLDNSYKISTFNIGYGALGKEEDFFMDGGSKVRPDKKSTVISNLKGIRSYIENNEADFQVLQEVDKKSKRSYYIDEIEYLSEDYDNYSFTYNYKVQYVPYPLPTIGKVKSGLLSLSQPEISLSYRKDLYNPFSWPIRLANLNRGLLVNEYDIVNSDKKFILINLHMDAFESGEGRRKQTKELMSLMDDYYEDGHYVLAAGDFNQTLLSENIDYTSYSDDLWKPVDFDSSQLQKGFRLMADENNPTARSLDRAYRGEEDFLKYYIDGFVVSPNIEVFKVEVVDLGFEHSDHNPVEMEFLLVP